MKLLVTRACSPPCCCRRCTTPLCWLRLPSGASRPPLQHAACWPGQHTCCRQATRWDTMSAEMADVYAASSDKAAPAMMTEPFRPWTIVGTLYCTRSPCPSCPRCTGMHQFADLYSHAWWSSMSCSCECRDAPHSCPKCSTCPPHPPLCSGRQRCQRPQTSPLHPALQQRTRVARVVGQQALAHADAIITVFDRPSVSGHIPASSSGAQG